ncbi:hypothetical protein BFGS084_01449 [Bacteroides fragilis]|nr:hypothetical protein HMPREF1205_02209 [Bacteroides fragilis HMW 616]WMI94039.1 hypothetical protein BFGS084_01449 [Bacteroides fragilis]
MFKTLFLILVKTAYNLIVPFSIAIFSIRPYSYDLKFELLFLLEES